MISCRMFLFILVRFLSFYLVCQFDLQNRLSTLLIKAWHYIFKWHMLYVVKTWRIFSLYDIACFQYELMILCFLFWFWELTLKNLCFLNRFWEIKPKNLCFLNWIWELRLKNLCYLSFVLELRLMNLFFLK